MLQLLVVLPHVEDAGKAGKADLYSALELAGKGVSLDLKLNPGFEDLTQLTTPTFPTPPLHQSKVLMSGFWHHLVAAYMGVLLLAGGISQPSDRMLILQTSAALIILALALHRLFWLGFPTRLARLGAILAAAAIGLPLIQLLPLPEMLWHALPFSDVISQNSAIVGQVPRLVPLSLTPAATRLAALALLPALAAYFAVLTLNVKSLSPALWIVLGSAAVSVIFALIQHFQGPGSSFYLYGDGDGLGLGTFSNRNFFACQMAVTIAFVGLQATLLSENGKLPRWLIAAFGFVGAVPLLAGLATAGSRAGIVLGMISVLIATTLFFSSARVQMRKSSAITLAMTLLAFLIVGQSGMLGILRLASSDPVSDFRRTIAENSWAVLNQAMPTGTGFGSFVPIYKMQETASQLMPEFVNHAHNDWLEVAIEGGVPAVILELAFLILSALAAVRIWRYGDGAKTAAFQRTAVLILPLFLMHSLVDYPLRTPALATLFAFCCAVAVLPPSSPSRTRSNQRR
jgi:O-antigen ligase